MEPDGTVSIRHALPSDLDAITAVEAACFPPAEAADRAAFAARIAAFGEHFWLLFTGGRLVSFVDGAVSDSPVLSDDMYADASLHDEGGRWQMIFGVNTLPEYRGRGFASMLLRRVAADAAAQGRSGVLLTCKEHMIPFYERLGFVPEGRSGSTHGGAVWYCMKLPLRDDG